MRTGKRPTKITGDGQGSTTRMETCQSCRANQAVDSFIFCETCITIVCEGCRASRHGHHKTNRLDVAASDVKKISLGYVSPQAGPVKISDIQAVEQLTQSLKDELLTLETDTIEKIKKHISALKEQLDDICNALIQNVSEVVSTELKSLRKMEGEAKKLAASISDMCEQAGQLSRDEDDFNVVSRGFSLCEELREAMDTKLPTPVKGPSFGIKYLPGSINRSSLEDMGGEVSTRLLFYQFMSLTITYNSIAL